MRISISREAWLVLYRGSCISSAGAFLTYVILLHITVLVCLLLFVYICTISVPAACRAGQVRTSLVQMISTICTHRPPPAAGTGMGAGAGAGVGAGADVAERNVLHKSQNGVHLGASVGEQQFDTIVLGTNMAGDGAIPKGDSGRSSFGNVGSSIAPRYMYADASYDVSNGGAHVATKEEQLVGAAAEKLLLWKGQEGEGEMGCGVEAEGAGEEEGEKVDVWHEVESVEGDIPSEEELEAATNPSNSAAATPFSSLVSDSDGAISSQKVWELFTSPSKKLWEVLQSPTASSQPLSSETSLQTPLGAVQQPNGEAPSSLLGSGQTNVVNSGAESRASPLGRVRVAEQNIIDSPNNTTDNRASIPAGGATFTATASTTTAAATTTTSEYLPQFQQEHANERHLFAHSTSSEFSSLGVPVSFPAHGGRDTLHFNGSSSSHFSCTECNATSSSFCPGEETLSESLHPPFPVKRHGIRASTSSGDGTNTSTSAVASNDTVAVNVANSNDRGQPGQPDQQRFRGGWSSMRDYILPIVTAGSVAAVLVAAAVSMSGATG